MKKILLLSIGLLSLQLSAQSIKLTIQPNSIKVQNDSLYFKYKIQNNSDTIFVLYNVGLVDFVLNPMLEDNLDFDSILSNHLSLTAFIYDKNDNLPTKFRTTTWPFRDPRKPVKLTYEEKISSFHGKYILLKKRESIEYERRLYIANIGLEKGPCKFQLVYYSLDHQNTQEYKKYVKAKKQNIRLKNSFMFEGKLKSNVCSFENPYVKRDD